MAVVLPFPTPWENNYARQADSAFYEATGASRAELQALRPPLPQIRYLPPRFGYPTFVERQWTLEQVFGLAKSPIAPLPPPQTYKTSGFPEIEGSDRLTNGGDQLGLGGQNW